MQDNNLEKAVSCCYLKPQQSSEVRLDRAHSPQEVRKRTQGWRPLVALKLALTMAGLAGLILTAPSLMAETSSTGTSTTTALEEAYSLTFDPGNYTTGSMEVTTPASHTITYMLYQNIVYTAKPVDYKYESMNVYVPTAIDGMPVSATDAPILLDIGVAGYMSSSVWVSSSAADSSSTTLPGTSQSSSPTSGPPNTGMFSTNGQYALAAGYVVVQVGCRGRDNETSSGTYYGKAPSAIVDLKAAVRYIRYNADSFPGSENWIVSSGGSAGGALSALLGASGNSSLYSDYLAEIGAASADDNIFAVAAYSPITNLDHADGAYEWEYGTACFNGSQVDQAVSEDLKKEFQNYQNGLMLAGNGSFGTITADNIDTYILQYYLIPSASTYLSGLSESERSSYLNSHSWITWNSSTNTASFTWEDYVRYIGRGKSVPAFDSFFDLSSPGANVNTSETAEVILFGNETTNARHFTNFGLQYVSGSNASISSSMQAVVNMMNPMVFILNGNSDLASYWLIRDGAKATDTSAIVIIDLATALANRLDATSVNAWEYWDGGHNENQDPATFISWITGITGYSSLWQDAVDLGNGWRWLSWFGYFNVNSVPWIYHQGLGWLYPSATTTDSINLYDPQTNAYWWTSSTCYPYLYRLSDGTWRYYQAGTTTPRWFFNFSTGQWETN